MTIPTWKWNNFLNNNFSNEYQEGYIETTPDAGVPFRRERFSDIQDIVSGSISLVNQDYIDFMAWFKNDIKQGTIPFYFYDCRIQQNRIARLTMNKPQYSRTSNRWTVAITMTFDSDTFRIDRALSANIDIPLFANNKYLCGSVYRSL